jgi:large subunit ribosomal protein L2
VRLEGVVDFEAERQRLRKEIERARKEIAFLEGKLGRPEFVCRATIGNTSNPDHGLQVYGKAGRRRWIGKRPRVRGVAMNPVDHPMGGGEGRASGGHPRSRTGIMAKGEKTRNTKKASSRLIISKRKNKN